MNVEEPNKRVVFKLQNGAEFHVVINDEDKLKIQCVNDSGSPGISVEPRADNSITLTTRV